MAKHVYPVIGLVLLAAILTVQIVILNRMPAHIPRYGEYAYMKQREDKIRMLLDTPMVKIDEHVLTAENLPPKP